MYMSQATHTRVALALEACHYSCRLHRGSQVLRNTYCSTRTQSRTVGSKLAGQVVCARSVQSAKQIKVDSQAQAAFAKHLSACDSTSATTVAIELLQQAVKSQKVQPYLALGAALCVEQHSSGKKDTLAELNGRWQLVFASTSGSTLFWYIPVQEFKDIDIDNKTCNLVSYLGPVTTSFNGSYTAQSKQDMQFKFTTLVITAFGRTVVERPISFAEKVYTYYWLQGNLACARSSGGGIVLLKRKDT